MFTLKGDKNYHSLQLKQKVVRLIFNWHLIPERVYSTVSNQTEKDFISCLDDLNPYGNKFCFARKAELLTVVLILMF